MAFGFTRQSGTSRGYVNQTNPDFAYGQRLSRRQYDAYLERLGERTHLPGIEILRETERKLEALRDNLAARSAALDEREAEIRRREIAMAEQEAEKTRAGYHRKTRQRAGQNVFNAALDRYVRLQRERGNAVTKRAAKSSPEFKAISAALKPIKSKNPNVRAREVQRRRRVLAPLGTAAEFWEEYRRDQGFATQAAYQRARGRIRRQERQRGRLG